MSYSTQDTIDTILNRLRELARTETIVGNPIELGDVTLLPVIKINVGFGAGGGEGSSGASEDKTGKGFGGAGGGGASISPVGFLVWDGKNVKFIGIGKGKIDSLIETVPDLLRKFGITKGKGKDKDKEKGKSSGDAKDTD